MTATEPSVKEAAARAWSLIADHRAGRLPDEPGLPLGIALEMVTDSGCERENAFRALRTAASDALRAAQLPGGIVGNPEPWAVSARDMLHVLGAQSIQYAMHQLKRAEEYRVRLIDHQVRRGNLTQQQWRDRADWLAWADDARLAILWLRELAAQLAQV